MKYYLKETYVKANHAGPKARMDAEKYVRYGYQEYYLPYGQKNNDLNRGDVIILQFPLLWKSLKKQIRMKFLKRKNFKAYLLIHDIESLRNKKIKTFSDFKHSIIYYLQNKTVLERVDGIIAHNDKMKAELVKMGINKEKIISLEIFDYLIPNIIKDKNYDKDKILLAGNFDIRKQSMLEFYLKNLILKYMESISRIIIFRTMFTIKEHLLQMNCLITCKVGLVWYGMETVHTLVVGCMGSI